MATAVESSLPVGTRFSWRSYQRKSSLVSGSPSRSASWLPKSEKSSRQPSTRQVTGAAASSQRLPFHSEPALDAALTLLYPGRRLHEHQEAAAYVEMARLVNLAPSCILVYLGAWVGGGRRLHALLSPKVALLSAIAGSIAVASCVLNDFFDYSVDVINEPSKPLPRHAVPLEGALLLSFVLYSSVLIAACILEPPALRLIIAASAAATLLYTPVLKRLTAVKNLSVALVIALTPLTGALSLGQGQKLLRSMAGLCLVLFCGILHREILMDLNDVDGDRDNGVHTVPVVFGKPAALAVAACLAAASVAAAAYMLATAPPPALLAAVSFTGQRAIKVAAGILLCMGSLPLLKNVAAIRRRSFDAAAVKHAIEDSMKSIGVCLLFAALYA
ncbi:hypothetical protein CVIRNUC_011155 [Coccomyxa viridis]|uniref:Uncharacterized protein n=1 Tax=Coccomyxa viridis TaxID=1274662 RepID=A0AAV1IP97_9CHLO|nr:hypothetical protein CVIRNUC_011155 [Coccomyxa viridis]